jgi:hypothetical protein
MSTGSRRFLFTMWEGAARSHPSSGSPATWAAAAPTMVPSIILISERRPGTSKAVPSGPAGSVAGGAVPVV